MPPSLPANALSAATVRCFYEVAQRGSFRQAAEHMNIVASAVHRQVTQLEEQVGSALVERRRGPKGVRLTAAGEVLLYRISRAMDQFATGIDEIEHLRRRLRGKVRIGTTDALARDIIPQVFEIMHEENPGIAFDIQVSYANDLVESLLEDKIDILFGYDIPRRIGARTLAEIQLPTYAVVPTCHPLADRAVTTLAECAAYPLILLRDESHLSGILERMSATVEGRPEPLLTTDSFLLMRDLVSRGLGISIQSQLPAPFSPAADGIVYVPLREQLANFSSLSICVRVGRRQSPAASWFLERMVKEFQYLARSEQPA